MKRGELAKKKRKGCLTALLVVWAVFIVKVIAVLNPGFPEAWRMVEAGQIAGFAYIWLLVFLVLLCCFVLWRIVPKGYFRKKKPETSRPAGEWAVSIPTHENPVVVGNPTFGGLNDIIIFSQYIPDDRGYFFPAIIVHFLLHLFRQFHCYIWAKINGSYHPFYILAVTWKEGCQYVMNLPDALADRLVIGFLFFIFGMDKEKP